MNKKGTLYMEVYDYFKQLIENGILKEGEKLPSIRRCCRERGVSKTTVEQAYMCLCDDGYVMPKSQSGYYVLKRVNGAPKGDGFYEMHHTKKSVIYDFASSGADAESFNMNIWRRYMKSALRHNEQLLFYGEPQGEYELRCEIAKYVRETRNCVCNENNIVIGAGVQVLLGVLCPLIKNRKSVYFEDMSYKQGIAIFEDYGFKISNDKKTGNIMYVSPSYSSKWGRTMTISERYKLTRLARERGSLIIEDDYGSEFKYLNKPTPSLQGLDGGENVVYLGTFSKLLLPSIRISFMILPAALSEKYAERRELYNQTVSKADQIALCSYIRDGHLNSQIRKSRKLYEQKARLLAELLNTQLCEGAEITKTDSPLFVRCKIKCGLSTEEFCDRALKKGIALIPARKSNKNPDLVFSVSSVKSDDFVNAVEIIKNIVKVSY